MIEFRDAGKNYDGHWAVRDMNIVIPGGEIFALLGPNGAGKTTTIRMMTGIANPSEGNVLIGGHDIITDPIQAKSITGYVPDKSYLYEGLSGREFMRFVAAIYNIAKPVALSRTDELLGIMGIADVADELIKNYSHGMRQRLLFASALIHNPTVLVIDEPFVGLDPYGIRAIKELLIKLAGYGTTVFLATHSLHIAEDICHRAALINDGQVSAILKNEEFSSRRGLLEELFIRHTTDRRKA